MLVAQTYVTFCNHMDYAHHAPLSMEFSRREPWSELPFSSPGDLPNPGIKFVSPALQADSLQIKPPGKPKDKQIFNYYKTLRIRI